MGRRKLLIIGHTWPEPKATAAGIRMMQLIHYFKNANWDLTFACTSAKSDKAEDLQALGICFQQILVNDDSFDSFLHKLQPDMVLFDRFITEEQFGWRVEDSLADCIRILDTEDLHSLRLARQQAVEQDKSFEIRDWLRLDQTKRELGSIYRCDLSLIISRKEVRLLEDELRVPPELLMYLPFWSEADDNSNDQKPAYSSREGFVFIGNGKHQPNIDAIQYLNNRIWPIIREIMPNAKVDIYGAYLPESVKTLNNPNIGFHVKGYVEKADMVMQQAKINLVPVRYGAGLKGKILKALENGTPTITTSLGAEGILNGYGANSYIFDDPREFAEEAVRLYQNEKEWKLCQESGFDILETKFNGHQLQAEFSKALEELSDQLEEHRTQNFVGAMMRHHHLRSTKYLSKWITLKNELKTRKEKA
ncbi:glycosyltransferase [Flavobacteriaceae bacterium D16]|nr:glycosyltransferase [Flavobacteriaceae bacterium D16]